MSRESNRARSPRYSLALTSKYSNPPNRISRKSSQAYIYRSLRAPSKYIRLLFLCPSKSHDGCSGAELCGELLTFRTDRAPAYVALSYAWGNPAACRRITIGARTLHITENLAVALEHLREHHQTLVLWVDAICIDQANLAEKSAQIQIMGQIFTSASTVLAWIGPSNDRSDDIIQWLEDGADLLEQAHQNIQELEQWIGVPLHYMRAFLNRPWFTRVWVTQEVALGQEVIFICGKKDVGKNMLIRGLLVASSAITTVTNDFLPSYTLRFKSISPMPLGSFLALRSSVVNMLGFNGDLHCSDPRDFVFSLFGIITDLHVHHLEVDYIKSVEDVFTDFAIAIIKIGRINILEDVWRLSSKYPELPSWVPDWTDTRIRILKRIEKEFDLPAPGPTIVLLNEGTRLLQAHALLVDEIRFLKYGTQNTTPEDIYRFLVNLKETVCCNSDLSNPSMIDKTVYDLSITTCPIYWYRIRPKDKEIYQSYLAFLNLAASTERLNEVSTWGEGQLYLSLLQQDKKIPYLFTSSSEVFGVAPDEVTSGDLLCLIAGLRSFWIIRQGSGGHFRLISPAHVYGYKAPEKGNRDIRKITIC